MEATLPQSFKWFLRLFSFLLDIRPPSLYEEVLKVERRLFARHAHLDGSLMSLGTFVPSEERSF